VRIHAFEFICGGGLAGRPIPAQLAREGDLILSALIDDLLELPGVRVSIARDPRMSLSPAAQRAGVHVVWRAPEPAPAEALMREIEASDATWPIAPETGGDLERAARAVLQAGRVLLGAHPAAIALAGSKLATARRLQESGINVVPSFAAGSSWDAIDGAWVIKPDDGAGCVDSQVFPGREHAAAAVCGRAGMVAQPWIEGEAMSLSVVAAAGRVDLLSVNRQQVRWHHGVLELVAIEVNCEPLTAPLIELAERVAEAIPGLRGYFGIDFVRTDAGPVVIEVNPRLTSSYAGLRQALGINVARWVVAAVTGEALPTLHERAVPGRSIRLGTEDE
jgi:predicted ATP-grasp superfamily ATP-dependent carboligase